MTFVSCVINEFQICRICRSTIHVWEQIMFEVRIVLLKRMKEEKLGNLAKNGTGCYSNPIIRKIIF